MKKARKNFRVFFICGLNNLKPKKPSVFAEGFFSNFENEEFTSANRRRRNRRVRRRHFRVRRDFRRRHYCFRAVWLR